MYKFEISDRYTTADVGLELEADSLEDLFIGGAVGMFAIVFGVSQKKPAAVWKEFELRAFNPEQLLVDWLSELLYLFDTEKLIPVAYEVSIGARDGDISLSGSVGFRPFNRNVDQAEHEVKAVTYYKLIIKKDDRLFRCHVVFDL